MPKTYNGVRVPELSIIVPALNEAENLRPLVERIAAALDGRTYEILIVDDNSADGTAEVCQILSRHFPLRLIVRTRPVNGLAGAVLEGMAAARGEILAVMDADLQHPPEALPRLFYAIESGQGDFAIGSRYCRGASTERRWGALRRLNSRVATALARPVAGRIADPMSGFFALARETHEQAAAPLAPVGYKIALELICKCPVNRVVEVPIRFGQREHGQSKLSLREQARYLDHLCLLYDFALPRLAPMLKSMLSVGLMWLVGLAGAMLLWRVRLSHPLAIALGYGGCLAMGLILHRRERRLHEGPGWWRFAWVGALAWGACAAAALWLGANLRAPGFWTVAVLSFSAATAVRSMLRHHPALRKVQREAAPTAAPTRAPMVLRPTRALPRRAVA